MDYEIILYESGSSSKPLNLGNNSTTIYCKIPRSKDVWDSFDELVWKQVQTSSVLAYGTQELDKEVVQMMSYCSREISTVLSYHYDLIIVDEILNVHGYIFTQILDELKKVPYIVFGTNHVSPDWSLQSLALGQNSILNPIHGTRLQKDSESNYDVENFFHRLNNAIETTIEIFSYEFIRKILKKNCFMK